jgi:hypothetical protein
MAMLPALRKSLRVRSFILSIVIESAGPFLKLSFSKNETATPGPVAGHSRDETTL